MIFRMSALLCVRIKIYLNHFGVAHTGSLFASSVNQEWQYYATVGLEV